jgi:hypothetical protein
MPIFHAFILEQINFPWLKSLSNKFVVTAFMNKFVLAAFMNKKLTFSVFTKKKEFAVSEFVVRQFVRGFLFSLSSVSVTRTEVNLSVVMPHWSYLCD